MQDASPAKPQLAGADSPFSTSSRPQLGVCQDRPQTCFGHAVPCPVQHQLVSGSLHLAERASFGLKGAGCFCEIVIPAARMGGPHGTEGSLAFAREHCRRRARQVEVSVFRAGHAHIHRAGGKDQERRTFEKIAVLRPLAGSSHLPSETSCAPQGEGGELGAVVSHSWNSPGPHLQGSFCWGIIRLALN